MKRGARGLALRGLVASLAWGLAVFPPAWAGESTPPANVSLNGTQNGSGTKIADPKVTKVQPTNQQQAQENNKNNNDLGSKLAMATSILSMALGGLTMYQGVQDLSKGLSSECTAGGESASQAGANQGTATVDQINKAMEAKAGMTASLDCPRVPARFQLFRIFLPERSFGSGCVSGPLSIGMGALMLLQGIMGMQGAKAAKNNANSSGLNAQDMGSLGGSTISGIDVGETEGIKMDPALLRNGKANSIMSEFEKKFGISRDDFANAVANGADPREILKAAPTNAIPGSLMANGSIAASSLGPEVKEKLLADSPIAGLQEEMLAEYNLGAGGARSTASKSGGGGDDELPPLTDFTSNGTADSGFGALQVSPEVRAALEKQALLDQMNGKSDVTIFQMVHSKYREKFGMIYGTAPGAGLSGIADAEGN